MADLSFRNLLPVTQGNRSAFSKGVYTALPMRPIGAVPKGGGGWAHVLSSAYSGRASGCMFGPIGDATRLLLMLVVSVLVLGVLSTLEGEARQIDQLHAQIVIGLLSLAVGWVTAWRSFVLFCQTVSTCLEDEQSSTSRRFTGVMAVYGMNVLLLATLYLFAASLDPGSITHTDPTATPLSVYLDSVYDMTLVASGTGFGQRIPVRWFSKLIAFACSAYLTIYMTMTVFARMLSSSAMYMRGRPSSHANVPLSMSCHISSTSSLPV